ncbi:retrovirus-related pol polyprotein from transposon TNT 1-94 [Tanacetum coccineum]
MIPEQVKTLKIQAGVQVLRLEDKDIIFSIGSALEDFSLFVFVLVRNIDIDGYVLEEPLTFGNDHFAAIMGYGDLKIGKILILRVYYVEGLGHNLFFIGDSDLEVAFRKHTCFVRNLEGVDLLSGSHDTNLYTISMDKIMKSSLICLLFKASKIKSWLWRRCLSHLNFACQMGKRKKESHKPNPEPSMNEKLQMFHMDLCGPMRVESINKKKYLLVIIDDYSRFTWVKFLITKYETPEVIINILKQAQQKILIGYLTIHVQFDKLTQMASEQFSSGPELQTLTFGQISSGLVPNQAASTLAKPPSKNDLDLLFQPMFDEYFKHSPSVVSITIFTATPLSQDIVGASFSTSIDQDAPSPSTTPITETTTTPIQSTNVEEPNNEDEDAKFNCDTFTNSFAPPLTSSAESSSTIVDTSNMHSFQQPQTYIRRWIKDHSLVIIIGNSSKPISTRCQLATDAMWCYFHADLCNFSGEICNFVSRFRQFF